MDTKDLFDQGLKTRKQVLGSEYVDNSINNADEFGMKLQEFICLLYTSDAADD